MSYTHSMKDHITPEVIERLKDKSEEAKDAHTKKIIGHIDEVCGKDGGFRDDIEDYEKLYGAGIGFYYLGRYEKCMEAMELAFPHFNDEMGIAAIYWHTLAAWRCGGETVLLDRGYNIHMKIGHHRSYDKIMALAAGKSSVESTELMFSLEDNPLELSIQGYGLFCYLQMLQHRGGGAFVPPVSKKAGEILERVYADDGFWITYAYLAARNDKKNGGIFVL